MEYNTFINRGIFIQGAGKAGTTLMLSLLDWHPNLVVWPIEVHLHRLYNQCHRLGIKRFDDIYNYFINQTNVGALKKGIHKYKFPKVQGPPIDLSNVNFIKFDNFMKERLKDSSPSRREFIDTLILAYSESLEEKEVKKIPKVAWVEKPGLMLWFQDILDDYPSAKFIHMIRDPRANYLSWKRRFYHMYNRYYLSKIGSLYIHSLKETILRSMVIGIALNKKYGDKVYKIVRYEDLVSDPEVVMGDICKFIGVEFVDSCLIPTLCGKPWSGNSSSQKKFTAVSRSEINNWEGHLTKGEVEFIESLFKDEMDLIGYGRRYKRINRFFMTLSLLKPYENELYKSSKAYNNIFKYLAFCLIRSLDYLKNRFIILSFIQNYDAEKKLMDLRSLDRDLI